MKRMFSLVLTLCLLLSAAPVALSEGNATHIVLWHSMSENAGALLTSYIDTFNATIGAEKGITVEAVFQGTYAESVQKMNSMLSTGTVADLPDVMQLDATGKTAYLTADCAYSVTRAMEEHPEIAETVAEMLPPALNNWNLAGTQLGLPFATSTTLTYYNKTALDSVSAAAPDTLSDIADLAPLFAGDGRIVYAALPNTPTLANWLGQLGSYLVNEKNGNEGNATQLDCLENGALVAFLTQWRALYQSGALSNTAGSTDAFVAGQQLIMTGSSSNIASVLEKVGDSFEVGIAPYPRVSQDASYGASVNGSCLVMFDHADASRKSAAWELVRYLTGKDIQSDFASRTGYLPSHMAASESEAWQALIAAQPAYDVGFAQLKNTPDAMRSVTVGPAADFYYSIQNDISDFLEEDMLPEEGAELMADDLEGLLHQYALANP
ncbi:MAG: extracellular solute-binding protein [Clostridia bacterium]|nr:extracellular solute-binding protein [Clostridia bacterium]